MNKDFIVDRVSLKLRRIIEERYREHIAYVYLFGSTVEGRSIRESDVDVAIRFHDHVHVSYNGGS